MVYACFVVQDISIAWMMKKVVTITLGVLTSLLRCPGEVQGEAAREECVLVLVTRLFEGGATHPKLKVPLPKFRQLSSSKRVLASDPDSRAKTFSRCDLRDVLKNLGPLTSQRATVGQTVLS